MTELERAVDRLVGQVRHWPPARWAKPVPSGAATRGDAVYVLVQQLADAAADAEVQPHRLVPRLNRDTALPDQLRVLCADLVRVAEQRPDLVAEATARVRAVAAEL